MKIWQVVYERILDIRTEGDKAIALVRQYVRDNQGNSEVREFSSWAPIIKTEQD